MKVPRAAVVPESGPEGNNLLFLRFCEGVNGREASQKFFVIRNNCLHTGLLQHNFRDPDAVRIGCRAPGEIAMSAAIPGQKSPGDQSGVF